jgi:hypothetical protein
MSTTQTQQHREPEPVPGTPLLNRVCDPVIEIRGRKIRVVLEDDDGHQVELVFQPYQALKLTTVDCFLWLGEIRLPPNQVTYQNASPWLEELKSALHMIDTSADFMDKALHFTIPAGDDILEVAAWKIEIKHQNNTTSFPAGVKLSPF